MTSLLDALNNKTTITPGGMSPGIGSTSQVAALLKAKTGRAVDLGYPSAPKMSTLGEAGAVAQSADQTKQVQQAGAVQAADTVQKAAAVQTSADAAREQVENARLTATQQRADQTAALIQEYKQAQGELDSQKTKALAEQLGFSARLSSDMYVDQLERAGAESRLANEINFDEALANDVFGAEQAALGEHLSAAEALNVQENQWKEYLGTIDLDTALADAEGRITAANQQAVWTGAGNAIDAGVDAYGKYKEGKFDDKSTGPDAQPEVGAPK